MMIKFDLRKIYHPLLFWTLILCACSTNLPSTDTVPLNPVTPRPNATELTSETFPDSPSLPIPRFGQTPPTPHIDQPSNGNEVTVAPTYEGCGYQWAYKDMPEINEPFDKAIKALNPEAKAWATA